VAVSASQPAHHVAGFYRTDDFLAGRVAAFITEGLTAGEQVIVLATASHWAAIAARVAGTGLAFRRAVTEGQLLLLDATDVLDGLTVDGQVSVDGFRAALTRFIVPATRHTQLVSDSGERVTLH
jgi:KaiC/GvpD/RAD55 family RecA-like ATPase